MNRRLEVISIVLLAACCLLLRADVVSAAISTDELQKIEKAVPKKAAVKPLRPRKLLVFNKAKGLVHTSIPYATKAFELMAKKTRAFEIVVSDDMSIFNPKSLKPFDAICFNNSNRMDFKDEAMRESLMDFVRSGKGVVGIHAVTTNFSSKKPVGSVDWPEAAEMIGGIFAGHHWRSGRGEWAVKIDDPAHPLNAAFKGRGFKVADEIYYYKNFQKNSVRVLLSLDFSDAKTASVKKEQTYVPVSWVRDWGRGRVFYCSLGHDNHIFWNPAVLQHCLDGIQFALGDLPVDTMPQGRSRVSSEYVTISEDFGTLTWLASKKIGNAEGLTVGRVTVKAGKSNPRHRHPKCEEVLYLLKGRLEHTAGDQTFTLSAGDTITIAPNVFHNATCIGSEDADMIVVYSQGIRGFEPEQSGSVGTAPKTPPLRSLQQIQAMLALAPKSPTANKLRELDIVLLADKKDHGPNEHDYPLWQKRWALLLGGKEASISSETHVNLFGPAHTSNSEEVLAGLPGVKVSTAWVWPSEKQFKSADLIVMFCHGRGRWNEQKIKQLDEYLAGGGGFVVMHPAIITDTKLSYKLAAVIGQTWEQGYTRFRHGPMDLKITANEHPICLGLDRTIHFLDEAYWPFRGDKNKIKILATSNETIKKGAEETKPEPMFWTYLRGKGRVFGCVLGHYNWTFDDPYFRTLLLRGMAWAANESPYRFDRLILRGAPVDATTQGRLRVSSEYVTISEDFGTLTWLASKKIGNAEGLTVGRVTVKAGKSNPRHRHPKCEEVLYLLKGRLEHTAGDQTFTLSAGDTITIAPNVFHNATCIGSEDADMIVVYSQGIRGFELE